MTFRRTIITSTAILALAACGRGNDAGQANTTMTEVGGANAADAAPAAAGAAQSFANVAAASDAFEIGRASCRERVYGPV